LKLPGPGFYDLSFSLRSDGKSGGTQSFSASIDGTKLLNLASGSNFNNSFNLPFLLGTVGVDPANTILQFAFQNDPGYFGLSDVSVTFEGSASLAAAPGPIPGTGLLSYIALGLLGLGSYGWKRVRA